MAKTDPSKKPNPVRRFFSLLGPGLITGAADDDPSGVATYTIAGAQLGTSLLWTAFLPGRSWVACNLCVRASGW